MALQNIPFEHHIPSTDSNVPTGLGSPLVDNLFKKVLPKTQYEIREIDARTIKYYGGNVESSTAKITNSELLNTQASSLFSSAKEEIFEDGMESDFSRNLSDFIMSFGHSAMEAIIPILLSDQTNTEVASEALRVIGRLRHRVTYRERLWLLERCLLYSPYARVRDGALLGLSFLNDRIAISPLKSAIEKESIPELRHDMERVLAQLEGIKDGVPAKKDSKN